MFQVRAPIVGAVGWAGAGDGFGVTLTVALPELLNEATNTQALYANPSPLILAAVISIAFLWPMVRLVSILERRMSRGLAR